MYPVDDAMISRSIACDVQTSWAPAVRYDLEGNQKYANALVHVAGSHDEQQHQESCSMYPVADAMQTSWAPAVRYDSEGTQKYANASVQIAHGSRHTVHDMDILRSIRCGRYITLFTPSPAPVNSPVSIWGTTGGVFRINRAHSELTMVYAIGTVSHEISIPFGHMQVICPASVFMPVYHPTWNGFEGSDQELGLVIQFTDEEGESKLICFAEESRAAKELVMDVLHMLQTAMPRERNLSL